MAEVNTDTNELATYDNIAFGTDVAEYAPDLPKSKALLRTDSNGGS